MTNASAFDILPTEIIEDIGRRLVDVIHSEQPAKDQIDQIGQAVLEVKTLHPLTLIDRRFNDIFTPILYHQVSLKSFNSVQSFVHHTSKHERLCALTDTLFFSGLMDGSGHPPDPSRDLLNVLRPLKQLRTLRLWRFRRRTKSYPYYETARWNSEDHTQLRTIEFLNSSISSLYMHDIVTSLRQIERVVISGTNRIKWWNSIHHVDFGTLLSYFTALKSLRIHGTRFNFDIMDDFWRNVTVDKLEEIEFDSTMPCMSYTGPFQFIPIGGLDRWKDTLKVFRFRGDPIQPELKRYLDTVLENCEVVDILEVPVPIGEGQNLNFADLKPYIVSKAELDALFG
jgi:hypothetical protein